MTLLTATRLTKSFGPHIVLEGIDLNLEQGEHVGLIGKNGCGKSTLAKIIAGIEQPDSGDFAIRRDARVLYLAQEPLLDPSRTVLDTVLSGLEIWWAAKQRYEQASAALERGEALETSLKTQADAMADMEHHGGFDVTHRAESILEALGIHELEAQVGRMSGGEKRRVALARLLIAEPDLAILDEPTNHLDMAAIEWLEIYLADVFRGALLLITHDRYFLDAVVDRTVEIERGKTFTYTGGFGDYLAGRASRLALAERTEQNRQNFLRKELDWLSRSPPARTTKQQARIVRAETAIQNRPPPKVKKLDLDLTASRSGKSILDLDHVCIDTLGDAERPQRRLVTDLTLHFTQGERLGILGRNGCGKSTLLRAILGEHPIVSGRLVLGKNAKIAYLSQHRTGLDEDKSILENVAQGRSYIRIGEREVHAISYLENFLFTSAEARKPVSALSGGERTRVALAKLLQQETSLLLLDEPTNDLDLDTLAALEGLLLEHDITAIVVTHDRWFLDRIATAILAFEDDGHVTRYVGNYTSVQPLLKPTSARDSRESKAPPAPRTESVAPPESIKPAKKATLSYKEQKELDQIESLIAAADARVSELDTALADPAVYSSRKAEVPGLIAARDKARAESERLMERWAWLEEKRG